MSYKDEIDAAIHRVLDSGRYILGDEVVSFEWEFSEYLGASFSVGCGSGTDSLVLALRALNIGPGDEVIVPSHTAVPTVAAVVIAGASPVYADIEPDYFTIDPDQVEAECTDKTKAIIVVHLYGQAAEMDALLDISRRHNLRIIEDCAQAAGASYRGKKLGTLGDVGCFSFFPTKNLGAIGDGGAVVCQDKPLADRLRSLRQYGWDKNRISQEPGINSRLDELQAAILRVKLRHLDADNSERQSLADIYNAELEGLALKCPVKRDASTHVYHLYVLQLEKRDALIAYLRKNGIASGIHYSMPAHQMPGFFDDIQLPMTEHIATRVVSLPLFPGLSDQQIRKIADLVNRWEIEPSSGT